MGGFLMGTYREQLLRETYGRGSSELYGRMKKVEEESEVHSFRFFKIRFTICLCLFAGYVWLSLTEGSIFNITADQIDQIIRGIK